MSAARTTVPAAASSSALEPWDDDPAVPDHHDVVGDDLDLGEQVRGQQDRPAAGRRSRGAGRASSGCRPGRARWRARRGSAPTGRRSGRPRCRGAGASRASSCRTRRSASVVGQADQLEHLGDPSGRDVHDLLGDRQDLAAGAAGVLGRGVEHHADLAARVGQVGEPSAGDGGGAPSGVVRPTIIRIEVDLPAPFGPRKPVTRPVRAGKLMSCDGSGAAVALGQVIDGDHGRQVPWCGVVGTWSGRAAASSTASRAEPLGQWVEPEVGHGYDARYGEGSTASSRSRDPGAPRPDSGSSERWTSPSPVERLRGRASSAPSSDRRDRPRPRVSSRTAPSGRPARSPGPGRAGRASAAAA